MLFFSGLRLAGVAVGEILGYMGPVFVAALTPLVLRERFDRRVVVPLALALGGTVVILVSSMHGARYGPDVTLGAALAAASSLTYSLLILNSKRLLRGVSTVTLMTAENVTASVLLLPAALLLTGPAGPREWGALAVLALVHTVFTGFLFVSGLRRVRADHAAILTYARAGLGGRLRGAAAAPAGHRRDRAGRGGRRRGRCARRAHGHRLRPGGDGGGLAGIGHTDGVA